MKFSSKIARLVPAVLLLVGGATASHAAGVAILKETAANNDFDNPGRITATSRATGGVALAVAGQRVVAPTLSYRATISTTNSRYKNSGRIEANARATGGVSTAIAGQHVTL